MNGKTPTLVMDQGAFFPSAMRILFVVVGFFLSIVVIGLPVMAMAIYRVGTEIDMARVRCREYGSLLGWRWGKWQPLEPYEAIVILVKRRVSTMYSRGQVALDRTEIDHDVTLVDRSHRKKFVLRACESSEEASALALQVSDFTGFDVVPYAPHRSSPRR
ncbi:MAG: hypothetical protein KDB84_01090 [Flavobacteriales bacterium]|nr:hypothetical protein [Flavobacteriales bacterium]